MRAEFLNEKEKRLGNVRDIYRVITCQRPGPPQTKHKNLPLFKFDYKFYYKIN